MWSLPDIKALNEQAKEARKTIEEIVNYGMTPDGKMVLCQYNGNGNGCRGKVNIYAYYDIFSNDPKGYVGLCEHHDGYYGSPDEGYFTCDECGRVFVENYTWELYSHCDDEGMLCLNCYRERYLENPEHWIDLGKPVTPVTDQLVRRSPHLIAVGQDTPANLVFLGNTEFDSLDGHCISGGGNGGIADLLQSAKDEGYKRAVLILDAAYQFAVSIGVYAEKV